MHTNVYLSDVDQLYRPAVESLYAYDGGTDTVVRRLRLGGANTCASWDSVGHKLYVGQGEGKKLYAYDYNADSVLKVVDLSEVSAVQPDACVFDYGRCKAYVASFQPEPWATDVGILDTKCDTLLGVLPVRIGEGLYEQVAVDQQDDKAYLADNDSYTNTPDTLWVVDCSTDSVIKKVEYEHRGYGATRLRWVPWSNRLYMGITYPDADHNSSMAILDCNTDSLIVPQMLLNDGYIQSFQLDPIHQRIFVTGVNDSEVVVLRDTGYGGVAESRPARPRQSSGLQVQVMPGWFDIRYSVSSPCRVNLSIYDLIGREVRRLVAENQPAGQHSVAWSCQGRDGKPVARGVYFLRLDTPAVRDVQKVVITR